ncbi:triacylglycerol lipase 1-like [Tasmannia lanceolata]|uniref:triacylglycerol lipase 1-like n=1 Tax=Tasmannia lanceolata TaxID=3420 RepID=UPI004063BFDE
MVILSKLISFLLFLSILSVSSTDLDRKNGICEIFVRKKGFNCHEFIVRTSDLFLLSIQRISSKNATNLNETNPVFLYHGIMQGGDIWLLNDRKESLGFILADAGFDVWIGNTRSSSFTTGHLLYSEYDEQYWDWNFDDIVSKDVPSMLRFIRRVTKKRILFVGFSQGAMAGFGAFTNKKVSRLVEKAVMLSPVAYLSNTKSIIVRMGASFFLDKLDRALGVYRFSLSDELVRQILETICSASNLDCYQHLLQLIEGPSYCINQSRTAYYSKYELQSTSMNNIVHMAQLVRSGGFSKYDHGFFGNLFQYLTISPPSYKLKKVPKGLPILLAFGGNDYLVDVKDVLRIKKEINGSMEILFIPEYSHGDFVLGTCAHLHVYPRILSFFGNNMTS